MDRGPHSCPKVGGTRMNIAILWVQHKVLSRLSLDGVANSLDAPGEPVEHSPHVPTILHGDDSKLILLINPDKEVLLLIVPTNTSNISYAVDFSVCIVTADKQYNPEFLINHINPSIPYLLWAIVIVII